MSYKIIWQFNAEMTYQSEIEYIYFKWNVKEVKKFEELVRENLDRLALDPLIETFDRNLKIYFFLISKQTTLYYSINQNSKIVNLLVFLNNQKNPNDLIKLL